MMPRIIKYFIRSNSCLVLCILLIASGPNLVDAQTEQGEMPTKEELKNVMGALQQAMMIQNVCKVFNESENEEFDWHTKEIVLVAERQLSLNEMMALPTPLNLPNSCGNEAEEIAYDQLNVAREFSLRLTGKSYAN